MSKKSGKDNGSFFTSFFREKTPLGLFALLRLFVGYVFLTAGWQKYSQHGYLNPSPASMPLGRVLSQWLKGPAAMPEGWYRHFLESVVLPNSHVFGVLVCVGEVAVGIMLLLGLGTRLAGLLGAFMALNFYFASGHLGPSNTIATQTFVLANLLLMLSAAGRAWGADWFLRRAWPKALLW
jgi:thiosulfate dehydrogenase [quinone] large subunit